MFHKILNYVKCEKLDVRLKKDHIYIENYKQILIMEENNITIDCKDFILKIKGKNLIISRLENQAVSIKGEIISLEVK